MTKKFLTIFSLLCVILCSAFADKENQTMEALIISSPDFENEGWIDDKNSGYGKDVSPELQIKNLPPDTKTIVITFDDLDHPIQPGFNHWVAWNIPPVATIPANIPKGATVENPIHIEQGSAYGKNCYRGPKPPFNWNHRYVFTVYALDCNLELKANANKEEVLSLAKNHILAKGELYGKYQRKRK